MERLPAIALPVAIVIALTATAFAAWPVVGDTPWESDLAGRALSAPTWTPAPTATLTPTATARPKPPYGRCSDGVWRRGCPTPIPTPTTPNRRDCDAIRGTPYESPEERAWFLYYCITPEPLRVSPFLPTSPSPGNTYDDSEPREPSLLDCDFGERFDFVEDECEPAPWSCTYQEEYDYLRERCVPEDGY